MTDDTQATEITSDAEPAVVETPVTVETPAPEPETKKRAVRAKTSKPKVAKPAKPAKTSRAKKTVEAAPAPVQDEPAAKPAKARKPAARAAKAVKPVKAEAKPKAAKVAKSAAPAKRAKTAAKPVKAAAKPASKPAKVAAAKPARTAKKVAASGRGAKVARYTTNELNAAAKKAGLIVDFTPVVTKAASIGRGPARDFKVDAVIAHLRGSNGDLIRERGPGTPFYNDKESLAAVEIFEKFRGKTFHNKLKVELL